MRAAVIAFVGLAGVFLSQAALAEQGDQGFSDSQTMRAVHTFNEGVKGCATAPAVYRVDCLQNVFANTARGINRASAYWEAEVALTRVNRALYSFVRANTDADKGREKINGVRAKAVTGASLPEARSLYAASIDQAVQIMLSGNSVELRYFKPIADAVQAARNALN